MGVRILHDGRAELAILCCSTTDWAFGPVFYGGDENHDARDRAWAFLNWLDATHGDGEPTLLGMPGNDPRGYSPASLERLYSKWLAQEQDQYRREACEAVEEEEK